MFIAQPKHRVHVSAIATRSKMKIRHRVLVSLEIIYIGIKGFVYFVQVDVIVQAKLDAIPVKKVLIA